MSLLMKSHVFQKGPKIKLMSKCTDQIKFDCACFEYSKMQ